LNDAIVKQGLKKAGMNLVKRARKLISDEELAKRMGYSKSTLEKVRLGKYETINETIIQALKDVLVKSHEQSSKSPESDLVRHSHEILSKKCIGLSFEQLQALIEFTTFVKSHIPCSQKGDRNSSD
jgi:transcriptional regulator with XRE-family HTH domain